MIRVVVADDSPTARHLLRAILESKGQMQVVAEAQDGLEVVWLAETHQPDLIVLDVHMPRANGLEATREIMARIPTPILIVSAVRQGDVDLSLSATQAGALMALAKPEGPGSPGYVEAAEELHAMALAMAQVKVVRRWTVPPWERSREPLVPRREAAGRPELIAIAASTGGPAALRQILGRLSPGFPVPILIVQHIASEFTSGFADWLAGGTGLTLKLAEEGEALKGGVVYVAPAGAHLGVGADRRAKLASTPPIGGFRPSASYLFESAAEVFGPRLIAVVLTGMGSDGAQGLEVAHGRGAFVLAQDEASSVVFGMAREAVRRGVVDQIVPLEQIPHRFLELIEVGTNGH